MGSDSIRVEEMIYKKRPWTQCFCQWINHRTLLKWQQLYILYYHYSWTNQSRRHWTLHYWCDTLMHHIAPPQSHIMCTIDIFLLPMHNLILFCSHKCRIVEWRKFAKMLSAILGICISCIPEILATSRIFVSLCSQYHKLKWLFDPFSNTGCDCDALSWCNFLKSIGEFVMSWSCLSLII